MALRFDENKIDKFTRTPSGGLIIPAVIARPGVLTYRRDDGSVYREYTPPEVLAEAAPSFCAAPLTDGHPASGRVTPETWQSASRGHIGTDVHATEEGLECTAYAQESSLIKGIESGTRRELSSAYDVEVDATPGVAPNGERYDAIRTKISGNHVAVIAPGRGRAGPTVALRLDSKGNQSLFDETEEEMRRMKVKLKIGGATYVVDSEDESVAVALAELQKEHDATVKALAESRGRADAAEAELKRYTPDYIASLVAARVELVGKAKSLKADLVTDGKSDLEIMKEAIGPGFRVDGESEDYVRGLFEAKASVGKTEKTTDKATPIRQDSAAEDKDEYVPWTAFSLSTEA